VGRIWSNGSNEEEDAVHIRARIGNGAGEHRAMVATNGVTQSLAIPPKASGFGSAVNGGELLFLALATCFCNDLYREAAKRGVAIEQVSVDVEGEFGEEGEPASSVCYRVKVIADQNEAGIRDLIRHVDTLAEIQNTLRVPTPVTLNEVEVVSGEAAAAQPPP
jgi:uncharacterized OsmC-like protein